MDDLMLIYGNDVECSIFNVRNPSISEIIEYGKENSVKNMSKVYELGIRIFTAHPYDYMVMLDDMKIDFEKIDKFELFKILYANWINIDKNDAFLDDFYNFIFKGKYRFRLCIKENKLIIIDTGNNIEITKEIHNELYNLFSVLHGLNDRSNDVIFGQQILKKLYIKKARKRLQKYHIEDKRQQGLLSSKILPTLKLYNGAITMDNILKLNMYTMTKLLEVGIQKDSYDNVMMGIYTGNINPKTIDQKTFNWSNTY